MAKAVLHHGLVGAQVAHLLDTGCPDPLQDFRVSEFHAIDVDDRLRHRVRALALGAIRVSDGAAADRHARRTGPKPHGAGSPVLGQEMRAEAHHRHKKIRKLLVRLDQLFASDQIPLPLRWLLARGRGRNQDGAYGQQGEQSGGLEHGHGSFLRS